MASSGCSGRIFLVISLGSVSLGVGGRDSVSTFTPWCQSFMTRARVR
jgi:hypothetical protein